MEYYLNKDISQAPHDELTHWCPEEVITGLVAELQGKKYKYKKRESALFSDHWFWFVITKSGEMGIVSGLLLNVWYQRNFVFGYNKPPEQKEMPEKYHQQFKEYINGVIENQK